MYITNLRNLKIKWPYLKLIERIVRFKRKEYEIRTNGDLVKDVWG